MILVDGDAYRTLLALRNGEVVEFDGIKFKMDVDENGKERKIREGDLYIAGRNTGPKLLTAKEVVYPDSRGKGGRFIRPTTLDDYSFDFNECVKVVEAE